jgi:predicted methyltransferase
LLCFFATLLRKPKAVKQKHGIASLLASHARSGAKKARSEARHI